MIIICIVLFIWNGYGKADIQTSATALDVTNEHYNMEDFCGTQISMILDSVYQLKLQLDDIYIFDRSLKSVTRASCQTKIEPWYTWPNLMFYFESLDLDCELGYLQFFLDTNNGTRVKGLEDDICGDQKPTGVFTMETDWYFQITYVPKRSQYIEDVVSIILTSYASAPCPVNAFKCDNSRCIDREIRCDGYDSCGDESGCNFDLSSLAIAGIIISSVVGLFVLISLAICVVCCMKKKRKSQGRVQNPSQQGVVYTATSDCPVTFNPPTHNSGQNGQQGTHGTSSSNQGSYQVPASPFQALPLNITAGQRPAYPTNWTMPSYEQNYNRSPPPYEEIHENAAEENVHSGQENATECEALENEANDEATEQNDEEAMEENSELPNDTESQSNTDSVRHDDEAGSVDSTKNEAKTETASNVDMINAADNELDDEEAVEIIENKTNEFLATKSEPGTNALTDNDSISSNGDRNTDNGN